MLDGAHPCLAQAENGAKPCVNHMIMQCRYLDIQISSVEDNACA